MIYGDVKVQIIDYCDANNQERSFLIFHLNKLESNCLNNNRAQK